MTLSANSFIIEKSSRYFKKKRLRASTKLNKKKHLMPLSLCGGDVYVDVVFSAAGKVKKKKKTNSVWAFLCFILFPFSFIGHGSTTTETGWQTSWI